jgi:pimeloyl-ACP methyl ester carboxylesterase
LDTNSASRRSGLIATLAVLLVAGPGCAGSRESSSAAVRFGDGAPAVGIAGLDECDDAGSAELRLDPDRPLVVIVHGCNASGGRFRALAGVFEAHGQQTVCFNYDDRRSMEATAESLARALDLLGEHLVHQPVTVLGHSQGGLVARRALVGVETHARFRLVTVSSPFDGIAASADCAAIWLHVLTLGMTAAVCRGIAGDKWNEIHSRAGFIREPGSLSRTVTGHLLVVTDERDTCRRRGDDGGCALDDFVFSMEEQRNDAVGRDRRVEAVEVKAGHVEIVGDADLPPLKLIGALQEAGVLAETPPERAAEIAALLRALF